MNMNPTSLKSATSFPRKRESLLYRGGSPETEIPAFAGMTERMGASTALRKERR